MSSQRMRVARQEAIKELDANPCCPYTPMEARDDVTEIDNTVPDPTDDQILAIVVDAEYNKVDEKSETASRVTTAEEHAKRALQAAAAAELKSSSEPKTLPTAAAAEVKTPSEAKSLPGTPMATESKESGGASFFTFPWSGNSTADENATKSAE